MKTLNGVVPSGNEWITIDHFDRVEEHLPVLDAHLKEFGLEVELIASEGATFATYRIVKRD